VGEPPAVVLLAALAVNPMALVMGPNLPPGAAGRNHP
jgi:hypothetical protein